MRTACMYVVMVSARAVSVCVRVRVRALVACVQLADESRLSEALVMTFAFTTTE